MSFRKYFRVLSKEPISWMPNVSNGLRKLQNKLRSADCILEVHDVRIPISGRNFEFQKGITNNGTKPHILVLNKKDLTDTCDHRNIRCQLKRGPDRNIVFTSTKSTKQPGHEQLLAMITRLIPTTSHRNRQDDKFNVMIIGVPGVGKSSLIEAFHKRAPDLLNKSKKIRLQDKPRIYLNEKSGIIQPYIPDDETGMKMALVGCLPENLVSDLTIADYLLYWMNQHSRYNYVKLMGLEKPCDDINRVLHNCLQQLKLNERLKHKKKTSTVDMESAARKFVELFRVGEFGAFNLDEDIH